LARYFFATTQQVKSKRIMNNNTLKILSGFLLGAVLGMAAGLLVAPTTGRQARKKLSKKSKKLARQMAGYIGMEDKVQGVTAKRKNGKAPVEA
jgi:gas vesicle protein